MAINEPTWYVRTSDGESRPLAEAEIRELVTKGNLTAHDYVRRESDTEWHPAYMLRQLGFSTEQRLDLSRLQAWLGDALHQTCPGCAALLPAQSLLCVQCGRSTKQGTPPSSA